MNNYKMQNFEQPDTEMNNAAGWRATGTSAARRWLAGLALGLCLGTAACIGGPKDGADEVPGATPPGIVQVERAALKATGGLGAKGDRCSVTAGPYTGKSGTYDEDGWCCLSNVCVECAPNRCTTRR